MSEIIFQCPGLVVSSFSGPARTDGKSRVMLQIETTVSIHTPGVALDRDQAEDLLQALEKWLPPPAPIHPWRGKNCKMCGKEILKRGFSGDLLDGPRGLWFCSPSCLNDFVDVLLLMKEDSDHKM